MRPKFNDIDLTKKTSENPTGKTWEKAHNIKANWDTPEKIPVKGAYSKDDLKGMEHLNYAAGLAPYLR